MSRGPRRESQERLDLPGIPPERELLTVGECSSIFGCSVRSIRRAIREGDLVGWQAPGTFGTKGRKVTRASVEAVLRAAREGRRASA